MPQFPSNSERCLLMKYELKEVVVEMRYRNLLRGRILQFVLGLLSPENVVKSLSVKDIKCVSDPVLPSMGSSSSIQNQTILPLSFTIASKGSSCPSDFLLSADSLRGEGAQRLIAPR